MYEFYRQHNREIEYQLLSGKAQKIMDETGFIRNKLNRIIKNTYSFGKDDHVDYIGDGFFENKTDKLDRKDGFKRTFKDYEKNLTMNSNNSNNNFSTNVNSPISMSASIYNTTKKNIRTETGMDNDLNEKIRIFKDKNPMDDHHANLCLNRDNNNFEKSKIIKEIEDTNLTNIVKNNIYNDNDVIDNDSNTYVNRQSKSKVEKKSVNKSSKYNSYNNKIDTKNKNQTKKELNNNEFDDIDLNCDENKILMFKIERMEKMKNKLRERIDLINTDDESNFNIDRSLIKSGTYQNDIRMCNGDNLREKHLKEIIDGVNPNSLFIYKNTNKKSHCITCSRLLSKRKTTDFCPKCHYN